MVLVHFTVTLYSCLEIWQGGKAQGWDNSELKNQQGHDSQVDEIDAQQNPSDKHFQICSCVSLGPTNFCGKFGLDLCSWKKTGCESLVLRNGFDIYNIYIYIGYKWYIIYEQDVPWSNPPISTAPHHTWLVRLVVALGDPWQRSFSTADLTDWRIIPVRFSG